MKASYEKAKTEQPWVIKSLCNGCGPQNLPWLRPFIPQGPFKQFGDEHDFRYIVGGNAFDRRKADFKFGACCIATAVVNLLMAVLYVPLAVLYFILVRMFGWAGSFYYTKHPRTHEEVVEMAANKVLDDLASEVDNG